MDEQVYCSRMNCWQQGLSGDIHTVAWHDVCYSHLHTHVCCAGLTTISAAVQLLRGIMPAASYGRARPHPPPLHDLCTSCCAVSCRYADVQFTAHPAKYIKYAASDVASIIDDDLFETKAVSMSKLSLTKEKLGAIG